MLTEISLLELFNTVMVLHSLLVPQLSNFIVELQWHLKFFTVRFQTYNVDSGGVKMIYVRFAI